MKKFLHPRLPRVLYFFLKKNIDFILIFLDIFVLFIYLPQLAQALDLVYTACEPTPAGLC